MFSFDDGETVAMFSHFLVKPIQECTVVQQSREEEEVRVRRVVAGFG